MADKKDWGRSSRFKPGQSGNPKGRPRKKAQEAPISSAFDVFQDRRITVSMPGGERQLTVQEALFYRTYQDALAGERMAIRIVLNKIIERDARHTPNRPMFPIIRAEYPEPANIDESLLLLGLASQPEGRTQADGRCFLELEPWAVTHALSRPKTRLSEKQIEELKEQTRNPGAVAWPEGSDA